VIYNGDCLEVLATLPENSVDTCITDPPYELGFMGKKWDSSGIAFQPETWQAVFRVLKPGAILLAFGGTRTYHRMVCAIEDAGFEIRDTIAWVYGSGFPKSYDIGKGMDKQAGAERERIPNPLASKQTASIGTNDYGDYQATTSITPTPITPEAQLWDGWGTALKPAHEPIVVAMKPLDGTYVNNALTWGVAGLWIDGGRVGYAEQESDNRVGTDFVSNGGDASANANDNQVPNKYYVQMYKPTGRFPANLIHDGSDEVVSGFPNTKSVRSARGGARNDGKTVYNNIPQNIEMNYDCGFNDSGSAARFFYCAKASRSERNAGLEGINHHPTIKPIELMRYLVRLTKTPTGGVVLDPFTGSGTTGIACVLEGREFIGIEREPEYVEIAEKRIAHYRLPILEFN
jgi:site-specific DNA-methyltransferase (adenine-specific)